MVVNKVVSVYDADGKLLRTESITDYTKKNILDSFATIDTFTSKWNEIKKKSDIADMLKERGIDLAELKTSQEMSNVDDFDFICHIAYGKKTLLETSDLLSIKPIIYAANLDENTFAAGYEDCKYYQQVRDLAASQGAQVLPICAKVEQEIGELEPDERAMFLEELGIEESGLDRLIQCSYSLLGLISFLTCGSDECRAWTITRGTKAPQAAGKIHSDFERGFIRAEIVAFDDLKACGSMAAAKEKGLVRSEGKDYVMHDGDVTLFRFNV